MLPHKFYTRSTVATFIIGYYLSYFGYRANTQPSIGLYCKIQNHSKDPCSPMLDRDIAENSFTCSVRNGVRSEDPCIVTYYLSMHAAYCNEYPILGKLTYRAFVPLPRAWRSWSGPRFYFPSCFSVLEVSVRQGRPVGRRDWTTSVPREKFPLLSVPFT